MGSRVREGKHQLFEVFVEVTRTPDDAAYSGVISFSFPAEYNDEELLKSIPEFAFPFSPNFASPAVDHFTFVLTDLDSKFRFGFCRLSAQSETCLCLVSYYPWFEVFYQLLNYIAEVQSRETDNDIVPLLRCIACLSDLTPLTQVQATNPTKTQVFSINIPDVKSLPSIPDNRNLTEYYSAIDSYNMMIIFASMLFERRILVTSRKLSRLTACVHGAASLFYPFHWQHLYIPILPPHLVDYCCAPMPYLIGIHSTLISQVTKAELGDAVILDADTNHVTCCYDDLSSMPVKVVSFLKKGLRAHKKNKVSNPCVLMGHTVARAFLRSLAHLIGGYRSALVEQDGKLTFDSYSFVQSRSQSMQPFLERLLHLQAFEQFINERILLFQENSQFTDEFELEISALESNERQNKSKYKEMLSKYDRTLTDIASKVKSTSINTFRTVKTTFHDFRGADLRHIDSETDVKIVITPANSEQIEQQKLLSPLLRESKMHPSGIGEANRRKSFRLSTDDSGILDKILQQASVPLLSEADMETMFRKYSVDHLDSMVAISDESDVSRDNISTGPDDLTEEMENLVLPRFYGNRKRSSTNFSDFNNRMTGSLPDMGEQHENLSYSDGLQPRTTEVKSTVVTFNTKVTSKTFDDKTGDSTLKSSAVSSLSRAPKDVSLRNSDSRTDILQRCDQILGTRGDATNFHNRRKNRLSVRYLPNVKQIIQHYEKSGDSTSNASTKPAVRSHFSDSHDSLVARQAAHYTTLDRNAHLEHQWRGGSKVSDVECMDKLNDRREHKQINNVSNTSNTNFGSIF